MIIIIIIIIQHLYSAMTSLEDTTEAMYLLSLWCSYSDVCLWSRMAVSSLVCDGEPEQAAQRLAATSSSRRQRTCLRRGELFSEYPLIFKL